MIKASNVCCRFDVVSRRCDPPVTEAQVIFVFAVFGNMMGRQKDKAQSICGSTLHFVLPLSSTVTTPFALCDQTALQRAHGIMAWVWAAVLADGDVFPGR